MAAILRLTRGVMIVAVLFMTAWVAYVCLRRQPDLPTVVINLSFWIVPVCLLLALTGQPWKSFALGTALTFVLQRLHWLKWKYLSTTWTAADIRMLFDPANWLVVRLYPYIAGFTIACVTGLALSWLLVPRRPRLSGRARLVALLAALGLIAFDTSWRDHHVFDPFGFNTYGHFANLLFSVSSMKYRPPVVNGDSRLFRERARELPARDPVSLPHPPDIVVWLQESTTDPRIFDLPGATLPALTMHEPDVRTRESGWLRVHTWGGSTWLSEFALLTGLTHEDFGTSGVFYTVTPRLRFSLPRLLERYGYRTVVLTAVPKAFYNAETAYRDLGFSEVLTPLDFPEWGGKPLDKNIITDAELCRYALQVFKRPREQPIFLYLLSMIEHGPYDSDHEIGYGLGGASLTPAAAARLSDWMGRMETLSRETGRLSAELLGGSRPVVFAYFGDHQPNLEGPIPHVPGLRDPQYLTRYTIKTSDESPASGEPPQVLDISYLGSLLLEHAGLPPDELFAANDAMRRLCAGRLIDCPDDALRQSYRAYLYRDLQAAGARSDAR